MASYRRGRCALSLRQTADDKSFKTAPLRSKGWWWKRTLALALIFWNVSIWVSRLRMSLLYASSGAVIPVTPHSPVVTRSAANSCRQGSILPTRIWNRTRAVSNVCRQRLRAAQRPPFSVMKTQQKTSCAPAVKVWRWWHGTLAMVSALLLRWRI